MVAMRVWGCFLIYLFCRIMQNITIWKQNEMEYKITYIALPSMLIVLLDLIKDVEPLSLAYIKDEHIDSLFRTSSVFCTISL